MATVRELPGIRHGGTAGQRRVRSAFRGQAAGPWAAVTATVAWSLWELRAMLVPAQYLNDGAVHELMVRFAAARIAAGHDPLTSWFPYLGLGSPQFLHYQGTPAILTGLAGLVVGPDAAFRWSLYLLWCFWPVAIYASARLLRLDRWAAAMAAVAAPLLHSVPGVGYEQHAYVWLGYGVWTQLWGSWALPFAWALTWRALADKRFLAPAAALVALTTAFHFETGYLAYLAIVVLPFLIRRELAARLARAAALLAASLLASAWVVVPLLRYARWAGINQALTATPLVNGYGARQTLGWLVTGRLLDYGHLPVVTLFAAIGLAVTALAWRRAGPGRALVALFCAALVLSFGHTTFGGLIAVVPGHADLFFRRFLMGAQLAAIYLAGLGAAAAVQRARLLAARLDGLSWAPGAVAVAAVAALLAPVWRYYDVYDAVNAARIHAQQAAQRAARPELTALATALRQHGPGRVFAGTPTNGGQYITVGHVPVYAYLASMDVDTVGFTLRTASLMTQPEYRFAASNLGDYALFGIRYVILPAVHPPPPGHPAKSLILRGSRFWVIEVPGNSYIRVADTVGSVTADRASLGARTARYLRSALPGAGWYLGVGYAGRPPAAPTLLPGARPTGAPGTVVAEHPDLADGRASAVVRLRRQAVVVLAVSYDPGWSATVDGHPAPVRMLAPALAGVAVPAGLHHVAFRYAGFGGYPPLLALAVADLLAVAVITRRRKAGTAHRSSQGASVVPGPDASRPGEPALSPPMPHGGAAGDRASAIS